MKSLDEINPRTNDIKWKDQVLWAEMPKIETWYQFRIVGGVFTYAQHWLKFVTKQGKETSFPVDCLAWSNDLEAVDPATAHTCPGCQAGIKPAIKYMFNVIDRAAQGRGDAGYVKGFELPPTAMKKILDLRNLNMVQGRPFSVAHPDHGCDLYIQKCVIPGKKGHDWQFQKGDRSVMSPEERAAEIFEFDTIYAPGDANNARMSLIRAGYLGNTENSNNPGNSGGPGSTPTGAQMPPSGAQMPPSGSQMPPTQNTAASTSNPIGFQTPAQQHVQLPVTNNPPPATQMATGSLGRPPADTQGQTERPQCFGGFLGAMECIKCVHKPQCLQVTSERS
jgi:hypothetical protein